MAYCELLGWIKRGKPIFGSQKAFHVEMMRVDLEKISQKVGLVGFVVVEELFAQVINAHLWKVLVRANILNILLHSSKIIEKSASRVRVEIFQLFKLQFPSNDARDLICVKCGAILGVERLVHHVQVENGTPLVDVVILNNVRNIAVFPSSFKGLFEIFIWLLLQHAMQLNTFGIVKVINVAKSRPITESILKLHVGHVDSWIIRYTITCPLQETLLASCTIVQHLI
mmetsp:Transcript_874/g.3016  ORF Transcript_874/g.3016 Transcript_874/m.3016 type:complete len:227 (-) Transcript_874:919-1599(-)